MIKNKIILLITALIGINTGIVIGAEVAEKAAFTRTVCKEMANMYAYNKYTVDESDLKLFLEYKSIASLDELIDVLEQGKILLTHDILAIKTENKSALSYWAASFAAFGTAIGGLAGYVHEDIKDDESQCTLLRYAIKAREDEMDVMLIAPYVLSNGKFDSNKYFNDVKNGDRRLAEFMSSNLFDRNGNFNERQWSKENCVYNAQRDIDRLGIVNGKFDMDTYNRLNQKPAEYITQNMWLYKALMAAGLITIPVVAYKLYGHYMRACNKNKEIAMLDAIIEQIKLIQQSEV